MEALLRFEEPETAVSLLSKWRSKSEYGLVVLDQFEELFTLNPPEIQRSFAALLGKLVLEADVHVLLAMRDDFLFQCQGHESLVPVFSELTPLGPLSESSLRRALVQPALACGYRFEDETLVDEMVSEVSRERGALPLLAFAASRLWDKRDREKGLLTREAYQEIGGVSGALAQHAEETLEKIGPEKTPIVRELFRNLVTAQGTRASRDVDELLSIFSKEEDRKAAEDVLRELVAARLLTSYETSVEIIHESLLKAWPRLVQWRHQDEGGALLRDQLRQAAHLWEERGRTDDLLWTGSSYREYSLWRERYSGALSATEEVFARAMTSLANRNRRRRRIAVSVVVASLTIGLSVMGALWKRAELQALRAEASKLLSLGQLQVERHPTAALAYAIKSLELADSEESRRFALRLLQGGSIGLRSRGFQEDGLETMSAAFSSDGKWLAIGGYRKVQLRPQDGRESIFLQGEYPSAGHRQVSVAFSPDGRTLVTNASGEVRWWSALDGRLIRQAQFERGGSRLFPRGGIFFTSMSVGERNVIRSWNFGNGASQLLGSLSEGAMDIDVEGMRLAHSLGRKIYLRSLAHWSSGSELLAEHSTPLRELAFHPSGNQVAASDETEKVSVWSLPNSGNPQRVLGPEEGTRWLKFSPGGRWLAAKGEKNRLWILRLWDLSAPEGSAPREIRTDSDFINQWEFDPTGRWLVTNHADHTFYWPLGEVSIRLDGHRASVEDVKFTVDGGTLLSASGDGTLRAWPLDAESGSKPRVLLETPTVFPRIAIDPSGGRVALTARAGRVLVVPLDGGPPANSRDSRRTRATSLSTFLRTGGS
jgi:hypothetical protein